MVIKLVKNPTERPQQPNQNHVFNNVTHNPALATSLQILFLAGIFITACYFAVFKVDQGPDSFILGTFPSVIVAYFVFPISFYAFNEKLRKYVWKGMKESFGLNVYNVIDVIV